VQAEENAAGPLAAHQNPFSDIESAFFQLILFTKGGMDKVSQVVESLYFKGVSRHGSRSLHGEGWEGENKAAGQVELADWGKCQQK
jgi:hypothetical protein